MSGFKPHEERVIEEANELRIKCDKLRAFLDVPNISNEVGLVEFERMTIQYGLMEMYHAVLTSRINGFRQRIESEYYVDHSNFRG